MFRRPAVRHPLLRRVSVFAAVAAVVSAGAVAIAAPASATSASTSFTTTGAHAFQVPAGISSIHVEALGGSGASLYGAQGGRGALVTADLPVTAGSTLTVVVGGNGSGQTGGANGGGTGGSLNSGSGGGGGGATDIRTVADDLSSRVLVAAGGGGSSQDPAGDAGGSPVNRQCGGTPQPGTSSAGGAGGTCSFGTAGAAGTLGQGGAAGSDPEAGAAGGGGGGGLYGGGGGAAYTGGAGGSSSTGSASNASTALGVLGAAPYVRISYLRPALTGITVTDVIPTVRADGTSWTVVYATLTNVDGTAAVGEDVSFSSDGGNEFTPPDDNGDGTYSVAMRSTTVVGDVTVTAAVSDGTHSFSATVPIAQTVGPVTSVTVTTASPSIIADGVSTTEVTAIATDAVGHRVSGHQLVLGTDDPQGTAGTFTAAGDGTSRATYTSSAVAHPVHLTVTDESVSPQVVGSADVTQTAGPAATIASTTSVSSIPADGVSTTTVTTHIQDAHGNAVTGAPVTVTSSDADVVVGATTATADGEYTTDVRSSTTIHRVTLTVSDGTVTTTAAYEQVIGVPSTVAPITLSDPSILANGTSSTLVVATITDATGHPVVGEDVVVTTDDPDITVAPVADRRNGTYSVRIFSSTTVHPVQVTVTDRSSATPLSGTVTFQQTAGAPASIEVTTAADQLVADGTSSTVVSARVTDVIGHALGGQQVTFSSDDAEQSISPVVDAGDGVYSVVVTSSTHLGAATITAHVADAGLGASRSVVITQSAGPATSITLDASDTTIVADGSPAAFLTATVTDAEGHPLSGQAVQFGSSDPGQVITNAFDLGNGTYSALLTASTTLGTSSVTASVLTGGPTLTSAPVVITQTVGDPAVITVTPELPHATADGQSTTTLTATITDAQGHPLDGRSPVFTTDDPRTVVSSPVAAGHGTYTAVVTSSTVAGPVSITVRDDPANTQMVLLLDAGAPAHLAVASSTPTVLPNGKVRTLVTAAVTDAFGNPVAGGAVPTFSTTVDGVVVSQPFSTGTGTSVVAVTAPAGVAATVTVTLGTLSATGYVAAVTPIVPVPPTLPVPPALPVVSGGSAAPVAASGGAAAPTTTLVVRTPADARREDGSLAYTGSDATGAAFAALALLAAGLLLRIERRRRGGRAS